MVRKDFNLYNFSYFFRYFLRFSVCSLCCLLPFSVAFGGVEVGLGLSLSLGLGFGFFVTVWHDDGIEEGEGEGFLLLRSSRQKCEYASLVYFCAFRQFSFICWSCARRAARKKAIRKMRK